MASSPGVGNKLYDGAAEFGQVAATIKLVIAIIVGIFFLGIGIYISFFNKNKHTQKVDTTITNTPECTPYWTSENPNVNNYKCSINFSYIYKNVNYTGTYETNDAVQYKKGDTFSVYIDPNNPKDYSRESKSTQQTAGYICIGLSFVIVLGSIFVWWLTRRYKFFAAAEGAGTGLGMVTGYGNGGFF